MESIMLLSFSAIASYTISYALLGSTYIDYIPHSTIIIGAGWEYQLSHCLSAFYIGFICAFINLLFMLLIGLCKQLILIVRLFFDYYDFIFFKYIMPPLLSGLIIGWITYCLPMTVGNGDSIFDPLLIFSFQQKISIRIVLMSVFGRLLTLALSLYSYGFIGGIVYPLLTIGFMTGIAYYLYFPSLPYGFCIACFSASIPSCLVPMPYTLTAFVCLMFGLDLYQSSAVYIASITSYLLISGTGVLHFLQVISKNMKKKTIHKYSSTTSASASTSTNITNISFDIPAGNNTNTVI